MNPKDQLIKEIEELKRLCAFCSHKLEGRGENEYCPKCGPREPEGEIRRSGLDQAISAIKESMKGYKLVKKGDLLTIQEIEMLKSCGGLDCSVGQFNQMQHSNVEKTIRKLYALKDDGYVY